MEVNVEVESTCDRITRRCLRSKDLGPEALDLGIKHLSSGYSRRESLQLFANLVDLIDIGDGDLRHKDASLRQRAHEPLLLELLESFADGRPAHVERGGNLILGKRRSRLVFRIQDAV